MIIDNEEYKQIPHVVPGYWINSRGKVFSTISNRFLKTYINTPGYESILLRHKGVCHNYMIHRLLATLFISDIPEKMVVNHIDGNKLNNSLNNLEIVSYRENSLHYTGGALLSLICKSCSNIFEVTTCNSHRIYCSDTCYRKGSRDLDSERIIKYLHNNNVFDNYSMLSISKLLGISDNGIRKILKRNNLVWNLRKGKPSIPENYFNELLASRQEA